VKVNTLTKTVEVTISNMQILDIFIDALTDDARLSFGKERTLYKAIGCLIGIGDVEAVKIANNHTAQKEHRITTDEFRKWLPTVFSEFARAMLEANDD